MFTTHPILVADQAQTWYEQTFIAIHELVDTFNLTSVSEMIANRQYTFPELLNVAKKIFSMQFNDMPFEPYHDSIRMRDPRFASILLNQLLRYSIEVTVLSASGKGRDG